MSNKWPNEREKIKGEQTQLMVNEKKTRKYVDGSATSWSKHFSKCTLEFSKCLKSWRIVSVRSPATRKGWRVGSGLEGIWLRVTGHITNSIRIFCPSTWPGYTSASNWKLPSELKVNRVCLSPIQGKCFSPNTLLHKFHGEQVLIPCAISVLAWPASSLCRFSVVVMDTWRWRDACLWMGREWVSGIVTLGEWVWLPARPSSGNIMAVCLMDHQSTLYCSVLIPLSVFHHHKHRGF